MKRRFRESRRGRRRFGRSADRTHRFNKGPRPMRGGIRL